MAEKHRIEDEHDRDITLAWRIANLTRAKQMPELNKLLIHKRQPAKQTPEQQRSAMQAISVNFGIPLRRRTRGQ